MDRDRVSSMRKTTHLMIDVGTSYNVMLVAQEWDTAYWYCYCYLVYFHLK